MKLVKYFSLLILFVFVACSLDKKDVIKTMKFETFEDSLSYALGVQLGSNARRDSLKLNMDIYQKGYFDGRDSSKLILPDSVIGAVIGKLHRDLQEKQAIREQQFEQQRQEKAKELAKTNDQFLADYKNKPGVKISKSGLMWEVIKEGTGRTPTPEDILKIKFTVSFSNGEVFDSMAKNNAVEFPVRGLFPGWEEATQKMKVGGKYRFVFPPQLAFGSRGSGMIPPNAILIFDVELVDVKKFEMPPNMQIQPVPPPNPNNPQ